MKKKKKLIRSVIIISSKGSNTLKGMPRRPEELGVLLFTDYRDIKATSSKVATIT